VKGVAPGRAAFGVAAVFALAAASGFGASLSNAKIERSPASDLASAARAASSGKGPAWIGYSVPAIARHRACCGSWNGSWSGAGPCGSGGKCTLDSDSGANLNISSDDECSSDPGPLEILVKMGRDGRPERMRLYSESCDVDAGGAAIAWLDHVTPAESVSFLESFLLSRTAGRGDADSDRESDREPWSRALTAIALHNDSAADAALERFVSPGSPEALRGKTVFWLGSTRGKRGYEALRRLAKEDESAAVRKKVTFALSQSPLPEALETLIAMAKSDASSKVRSQALFWLAQKAGRKASETIQDAIRDDPETDVKKRAVFALSQLPSDEAATQLIRVARTNRNPEVRKQAIFWLGQSKDPRALQFLEDVLAR
jgi:hypothetical protein